MHWWSGAGYLPSGIRPGMSFCRVMIGSSLSEDEWNRYVMTARSSLSIREAADILGIAEQASINEIRSRYHALVKEWHPDVSHYDSEDTHNTMIRLNDAYDILIGYCMQYEISFRAEDLRPTAEREPMDTWMERYGDDPIWGPFRSPPHRSP